MSTYVLVHGAWHGSWCWKRVRSALRAQGHEVFTPTLTGVGERSHLIAPEVNLDTHIDDVVNLIKWEDLSDVVLCGHSYGGCVVSGVADRVPDRIHGIVYLDAFVLGDGECLFQHVPAEQRALLEGGAREIGDGWKIPPIPAEVFAVNENDRDWVNSQCTLQSIATFEQPIKLTGALDQVTKLTYIRATNFVEGSPFGPFEDTARTNGWKVVRLAAGHDVMLDLPAELTEVLLDAAA